MRARALCALAFALSCTLAQAKRAGPAPGQAPKAPAEVREVIGTTPPEWTVERWLNSPPLTLASLRGKVVLVRWWTAGCPYCSASAPALRDFQRRYADRGLVVVGLYHHKDEGPFQPAVFERTAREYGFTFPLAVDPDWKTLRSWWLAQDKRRTFTSVSFLIDREGRVRHVHPGGQYVEGDPDHARLKAAIETALAEVPPAALPR